jgi:ABC-type spermidine/putrescine transport system permease subunit II
MKKILAVICFSFLSFSANSEILSLGVSGNIGQLSADGKETLTGTSETNVVWGATSAAARTAGTETTKTTKEGDDLTIGYISVFGEIHLFDSPLRVGMSYVPYALESETTDSARADLCAQSASCTTTDNKVQVDLEDLMTMYVAVHADLDLPFISSVFVKGGIIEADVITNEKLGTGSSYGNTQLSGEFIGLGVEKKLEDQGLFVRLEGNVTSFDKIQLNRTPAIVCFSACSLLFLIAFGLPFIQLLAWSDLSEVFLSSSNIKLFMNSGFLGFFTASLISITALVLSLAYAGSNKMKSIFTAATIGYALPGSVIAVGLLIVINELFGVSITSMGIFGLVLCLSIRFMTPAFQYLISALENIPESSKQALSTLPVNSLKAFTSLYLPSMRPALLVAFLVVFIEVVKEQPATLILRPVGFETLSSKIYNFTSEGQWELAANPSLLLVMLSFILVYFLNKRLDKNE